MTHTQRDAQRIVAIDFCNQGVGFVVLEGTEQLVDWGVRRVRAGRKVANPELVHIKRLLRLYRPHTLIFEDVIAPGCRRGLRAKDLTYAAGDIARMLNIQVHPVSASVVRNAFGSIGARTKAQIAAAVALRFPVLIRHLPPLRKPWMSEDYRFGIFDAAAFLLTHLSNGGAIVLSADS